MPATKSHATTKKEEKGKDQGEEQEHKKKHRKRRQAANRKGVTGTISDAGAVADDVGGRMEGLACQIEDANQRYYSKGGSPLSDAEYDALFQELAELESQHPQVASVVFATRPSPTQKVGHSHPNKVLSRLFVCLCVPSSPSLSL